MAFRHSSGARTQRFLNLRTLLAGASQMPSVHELAGVVPVCVLYVASIAALHHLYLTHPWFDLNLLNHIHHHATSKFTVLAGTLSFIGSPHTLWPTVLLAAVILWRCRLRSQAVFLLVAMASSGLLETLVKLAVRRPRPAVPWAYVQENTYSFPSGHATLAFALYGTILYLTRRRPASQRFAAAALAASMIVAIGVSRLYLGAHNPTDVLAGYLTGAACLLLVVLLSPRHTRPAG